MKDGLDGKFEVNNSFILCIPNMFFLCLFVDDGPYLYFSILAKIFDDIL